MDFVFFITLLITFILLGRIVYYFYVDNGVSTQKELKTVKTLIFLGSGGHTSEMLKIVQNLDIDKYTPRVYIHGALDVMSYVKLQRFEKTNEDFTVHTITRSREVGQSYFTSVITSFIALCRGIIVLYRENIDLVLCNGPGTCVSLCFGALLLRIIFCSKARIIYVESFCRVRTLSLTGKILLYFVDNFIVQWTTLGIDQKINVYLV